ncbi:hypothetical protein L2E82_17625 [Cichorium intybus]|uniref:Uncharacterized protein n=1 Tax=Cichorium intybus TaxID=13427 RepID=A0ACB9F846_CICIN|nr:hypothetical protein L2E82_17625 [Cichorium intybus]
MMIWSCWNAAGGLQEIVSILHLIFKKSEQPRSVSAEPRSATAVFNIGTPPAVADVACDSIGRERWRLGIRKGVVVIYVGSMLERRKKPITINRVKLPKLTTLITRDIHK